MVCPKQCSHYGQNCLPWVLFTLLCRQIRTDKTSFHHHCKEEPILGWRWVFSVLKASAFQAMPNTLCSKQRQHSTACAACWQGWCGVGLTSVCLKSVSIWDKGKGHLSKVPGFLRNQACFCVFLLQGKGWMQLRYPNPWCQWVLGKAHALAIYPLLQDGNELIASCTLTGERLRTLSELLSQESYC